MEEFNILIDDFSIVLYECTLSRNNTTKVIACQILERLLALKGGRAENVSVIIDCYVS